MQESVVPKQKQYRLVLVDTWWYWVSRRLYWVSKCSKGRKYLGVRLKRSEIGHLYLEQADQYTQKRQQNIVKNLTR